MGTSGSGYDNVVFHETDSVDKQRPSAHSALTNTNTGRGETAYADPCFLWTGVSVEALTFHPSIFISIFVTGICNWNDWDCSPITDYKLSRQLLFLCERKYIANWFFVKSHVTQPMGNCGVTFSSFPPVFFFFEWICEWWSTNVFFFFLLAANNNTYITYMWVSGMKESEARQEWRRHRVFHTLEWDASLPF